jgi:hypothetical protein
MNAYFGSHVEADSEPPTRNTGSVAQVGSSRQVLKFDAARVEREIDVLGGLLEDRFKKRVCFLVDLSFEQGLMAGWEGIVSIGREYAAT